MEYWKGSGAGRKFCDEEKSVRDFDIQMSV